MSRLQSDTNATRRRGPSASKTARTRSEIVAAALDAFTELGFSQTRMVDVAERAGVAKGTLYLYFADKQALFEGVMSEVLASPIQKIATLDPPHGESVRAFLSRMVGPVMREMEATKRAAVIRLVLAEGGRFPALAEAYDRLALGPILGFISRAAKRAFENGEIRSNAPVHYPQLLMAPGLIAAVWNGLYKEERALDGGALFEAYLDLVFGPVSTLRSG